MEPGNELDMTREIPGKSGWRGWGGVKAEEQERQHWGRQRTDPTGTNEEESTGTHSR